MNGTTPQNAAFNNMQESNNTLNRLTNAVSGGRRRHRRKYKGGNWVAPQIRPLYKEVGGDGQTTVDTSSKLAAVQAQNTSYGKFDSLAQQGGRYRRKTRRLQRGRGRRSRRTRTRRTRNN